MFKNSLTKLNVQEVIWKLTYDTLLRCMLYSRKGKLSVLNMRFLGGHIHLFASEMSFWTWTMGAFYPLNSNSKAPIKPRASLLNGCPVCVILQVCFSVAVLWAVCFNILYIMVLFTWLFRMLWTVHLYSTFNSIWLFRNMCARLCSGIGNFICLRHLCRSTSVANSKYFFERPVSFMRSQLVLTYHLM